MSVLLFWRYKLSSFVLSKTSTKYEVKHIYFSFFRSADKSGSISRRNMQSSSLNFIILFKTLLRNSQRTSVWKRNVLWLDSISLHKILKSRELRAQVFTKFTIDTTSFIIKYSSQPIFRTVKCSLCVMQWINLHQD